MTMTLLLDTCEHTMKSAEDELDDTSQRGRLLLVIHSQLSPVCCSRVVLYVWLNHNLHIPPVSSYIPPVSHLERRSR